MSQDAASPIDASIAAHVATTFAEHRAVLADTITTTSASVEAAAARLIACYRGGGKVIVFGNGGSASDALHIEGELVGRFGYDRPGLPAIALAGASALTAIANDYGYADAFARMLGAHAAPGDVALGLSTSGNSENVVRALARARELSLGTIALTGAGGGRCAALADVCIAIPSRHTPRIQEMHITIAHLLCDLVERALFPRHAG